LGYDLYITRKDFWADPEGSEIAQSEWLAHVENDPEMRLDGEARADLPGGGSLAVTDPTLAVWASYSGNQPEGGNMAWFYWSEGNVIVKNPDAEIIGKMVRIAGSLNAKVHGEDDEQYQEDGEVIPQAAPQPVRERRPWWKFW
jgi:hypothetical protein